ncbi:hypothetical protein BSK20_01400 [SR1 bacterium human oral taxon HOT-345]|nr:hypothetical protein BSK20_01400 [SR1 bacterium human oral taxon HOT-345]
MQSDARLPHSSTTGEQSGVRLTQNSSNISKALIFCLKGEGKWRKDSDFLSFFMVWEEGEVGKFGFSLS